MLFSVRLAVLALLMLGSATGAMAGPKLTDQQHKAAIVWASHNSLFVVYHEVGHLLFDQLNLPVLGKEEDAADAFATYSLLQHHTHDTDLALADAAYGWLLASKLYGDHLEDADFYNEHSLDKQRAFQIVCYMVGSNPDTFRRIADDFEIDSGRQESCGGQYKLLDRSFSGELSAFVKPHPEGTQIRIKYDSASGSMRTAADAFKKSGVFEEVAADLKRHFALPNKITFHGKECGEPNAFYDKDAVEVIYCYELMDDFIGMISQDMPSSKGISPADGVGRGTS